MQYAVLQGLKSILQSCISHPERKELAFKYFEALAGDLVLALYSIGKTSSPSQEQILAATELVKILVLAHSISDTTQRKFTNFPSNFIQKVLCCLYYCQV
jgi:hypothetical protein